LNVVAAENFWGSIARQLGGDRVSVTSIVTNPAADPHDYEPTPADARAIASARYVIVNGLGYDAWASRLVAASRATALDVGAMLGLETGDNPHRWYFPSDVDAVIRRVASDYGKLDPADARYFAARLHALETTGLAGYRALIARIRARYAGTPVGASESVFAGLAAATGLRVLTPPAYMNAIAEGTDPTVRDKATVDRQITTREIKVFVYNTQNSTPDVKAVVDEAAAARIPVTAVTETLTPSRASFQDWQSAELRSLLDALARAG
jgi:zinc/manganese transport system substrate-binding protein